MHIVNAHSIEPRAIKAGDVMIFTVKAMVVRPGVYRIYRCRWEPTDAMPQGARIPYEMEVCKALFPSLALVAEPDL